MMKQVSAVSKMKVGIQARSLGRLQSTAATAAARRSAVGPVPAAAAIDVRAPSSQLSTPAVPAAVSYGAWTHANRHLTRQERIEGLREFLQARSGPSERHVSPTAELATTAPEPDPVVDTDLQSISCAQQPRTREERVAQIQRFAEATRASSSIDYSEPARTPARTPDPIIVSPLPAGWRLSGSTGMPVFSYGEWLRSNDDTQMDRTTAARQFLRYARK